MKKFFINGLLRPIPLFFACLTMCIQLLPSTKVDVKVLNTTQPQKLVLLTTLYNETNLNRCLEFIECLDRNLQHPLIATIHVLYDGSKDDEQHQEKNLLLNYLHQRPVVVTQIKGRPTFGDFFNLANNNYPNARIIIANGDIYFNDTLQRLNDYNLNNKFLALTRWDLQDNGSIKFCNFVISQDVWIFSTPLKKFINDNVKLGLPWCDSEIICCALDVGLSVINPCLSIQCCHLHTSAVRNHKKLPRFYWRMPNPPIPFSTL